MPKKVLVIDDDVFCLDSMIEYLSDQNFAITSSLKPTCPMLERGVTTCPMQTPCYNIVLSDNQMPGMTGLEFFQFQTKNGCKVPSHHKALISGNISSEDQKTAEEMNCKVFHKPTPLSQIDHWIDEVLAV